MNPILIPEPVIFESCPGAFFLGDRVILHADPNAEEAFTLLRSILSGAAGRTFSEVSDPAQAQIRLLHAAGHGPEGYRLEVGERSIDLYAEAPAGWFYGVQSLRQLFPLGCFSMEPEENIVWKIPCCRVEDRPRFRWRGMMLDCARHFFPVEEILRFLDQMALYKFNVFHWHLVDDQGWRLEIMRYPRLVEVGSLRMESPRAGNRHEGDGMPYSGYYTQEEVRSVVRYAAERQIMVIPEIEMPGHSGAAIAAYPELGNSDIDGYAPEVRTRWGVNPYIYAPSESVFEFLKNVLQEVIELFPAPYIHIGGDEAPKEQWRASAFAQGVMQREGLANEEKMQSWFLQRIEAFLAQHGRHLIGWDEIQEGGLSPSAVMMLWRDWSFARSALNAGNRVIMTPASHCYLDYAQGPIESEPEAICGELRLEKVYEFEPVPDGLKPGAEVGVLGIQGNVWTEYIGDRAKLDFMTWPRAAALAEVGWTPRERRCRTHFLQRLTRHLEMMKTLGIGYRPLDRALEEELNAEG